MKPTYISLRRCISLISLSIASASVIACGGGGGGDDRDSVPSQCRSYCSFACSKAASCGFFPGSQISSCDDSCVRTIASNGASAASCDRQAATVAGATCSQLASLLGLRSSETEPIASMKQDEETAMVAQHSGAEFALSISESEIAY